MSKNTSKIHQGILDRERQDLLEKLLPNLDGFVLGGGTALALQLAHRKSFDFDFFSSTSIAKGLLEKLSKAILIANVAVDTSDELTFFTKSGVKITFVYYPFPHAFPLKKLKNGLQLFSVGDIAIKKAYTIGRRGEYRDYFDLYTILIDKAIDLRGLILETKKIYGSVFEEKIFLQQLVYFDDLLNFDIEGVNSNRIPAPEEVRRFFEKLVREYV